MSERWSIDAGKTLVRRSWGIVSICHQNKVSGSETNPKQFYLAFTEEEKAQIFTSHVDTRLYLQDDGVWSVDAGPELGVSGS